MADSVLNFLLQRLSWLLVEVSNSFRGVEDQVESLHQELKLMNTFLMNFEGKRSGHETVSAGDNYKGERSGHDMLEDLIGQIGDVAYEAEDVIDTIIFNVATQTDKPADNINNATHVRLLHNVANKIEGLKEEINKNINILEEEESFENLEEEESIENLEEDQSIESGHEGRVDAATEAVLHKRWREIEDDDVVGFNYLSTILVERLTEGNSKLNVVSIVGNSGSGKTTLARKIYNNVDVKSHFNCRAWVSISKNFRTRDALVEILKSEMPKSYELTRKKLFKYLKEDELKEKLFEYLQGKKYLIVLDNIRTIQLWNELRSAFPDNLNGSGIFITSYTQHVYSHVSHTPLYNLPALKKDERWELFSKKVMASHASLTPPYHLPALNKDESWELFSKKVFLGGSCPTNLETLGRQILEGCQGLPLSIVVLAGILANKEKKYETWANFNGRVLAGILANKEKKYETLANFYDRVNEKPVRRLELCYLQLPRNLKPCFLYLGVFPNGFEIPVRLLIKLWVAEGFIQQPRNVDPEDVAKDYLEKLIDGGWVQVASRRTDGGAKTCRIHDLVQELCIRRSLVDKFLQVVLFGSASTGITRFTSRRVSLQEVPIELYDIHRHTRDTPWVRSLFFFNRDTYGLGPKQWKWVYENFKLGRVLNLGQVHLYSIPTVITKLIHLRYLGIESDALKAIPSSIGKLRNLETLNMKGTFFNCLPKEIWKLRRLRNLYVSGPVSLPKDLDPDDGAPSKLQVLSTVSPKPQSSLGMTDVRNLGLWFASDESNSEVVDVLKSLHHLHRLQTLKIINCCEYRCLSMSLPSTLTKITLRLVRLKVRRDMRMLGELPNLQILKLQSCLHSKLHVFAGSFPQLRVLQLENLKMKKWKQRRGAMPCLKHLVIKQCSELTMLPLNRLGLTALRDVEVLWSNSVSAKMLQELQAKFGFKLLIYPILL